MVTAIYEETISEDPNPGHAGMLWWREPNKY